MSGKRLIHPVLELQAEVIHHIEGMAEVLGSPTAAEVSQALEGLLSWYAGNGTIVIVPLVSAATDGIAAELMLIMVNGESSI